MSKSIRPPRGERRATAKEFWRKLRRQARVEQGVSFNGAWELQNSPEAERVHAQNLSAAAKVGGVGTRAYRRKASSIQRALDRHMIGGTAIEPLMATSFRRNGPVIRKAWADAVVSMEGLFNADHAVA